MDLVQVTADGYVNGGDFSPTTVAAGFGQDDLLFRRTAAVEETHIRVEVVDAETAEPIPTFHVSFDLGPELVAGGTLKDRVREKGPLPRTCLADDAGSVASRTLPRRYDLGGAPPGARPPGSPGRNLAGATVGKDRARVCGVRICATKVVGRVHSSPLLIRIRQ